jgi:hypothetical protein
MIVQLEVELRARPGRPSGLLVQREGCAARHHPANLHIPARINDHDATVRHLLKPGKILSCQQRQRQGDACEKRNRQ